ncbi:hypothetical protein BROUX41_001172 [Berkeleyomyces rouxiae]|uniref:uncharacterized protein n=1 Tax=Berkeleyomyces rouxiae TaxID=2035830 RepID=UPI003B7CE4F9
MASIASQKYTPAEEKDIASWTAKAAAVTDAAALAELNTHLATRATVLGSKPSTADVALYKALAPIVAAWSPEQRTGEAGMPHIVRLVDFVQNSALFELAVADDAKVAINADEVLYVKPPVDPKAEKEQQKKAKAAAAAALAAGASGETKVLPDRTKNPKEAAPAAAGEAKPKKEKKEKKEKQPKPQKAPTVTAPPSPSLIDLRVGHILKAIQHPDADSLYVSTIAVGDKAGDDYFECEGQLCRTVCSGLNGLVPLEEMQGRKVVVVCNLKPVKMRGIKSCAMVLAASPKLKEGEVDDHKGPVELVTPPADAKAGERVYFEGWKGEPEGVLNPKKKIWEMFQPGFTTTDALEVAFDASAVKELGKDGLGKLVTESGGVCKVPSLTGAQVR